MQIYFGGVETVENGKILWTIGFVIVISILIFLLYSVVTHFVFGYDEACLKDEAGSDCDNDAIVKRHFFIGKPYYVCEGNNIDNEYNPSQLKDCS